MKSHNVFNTQERQTTKMQAHAHTRCTRNTVIGTNVCRLNIHCWFNKLQVKKIDKSLSYLKLYVTSADPLTVMGKNDEKQEMILETRAHECDNYHPIKFVYVSFAVFEKDFVEVHRSSIQNWRPLNRDLSHICQNTLIKVSHTVPHGVTLIDDDPFTPQAHHIEKCVEVTYVGEDFFTIQFWTKKNGVGKVVNINVHKMNAHLFEASNSQMLLTKMQSATGCPVIN